MTQQSVVSSDQLRDLLQQEQISNIETDKQIELIKWQNKVKKNEITLFLLLIFFLFSWSLMRKAAIKRQYKELIDWIDTGIKAKE